MKWASGRMWNGREMKDSLTLWILSGTLPVGVDSRHSFHKALGRSYWHEQMRGVSWPLSGRRKMFYMVVNSQTRVLKVMLYTLDVENWEGVGANIQDIIESLPRTSYQGYELSPHFCCFLCGTNGELRRNWDCSPHDFKVLGSTLKDSKAQVVYLSLVPCDGSDCGKEGRLRNEWLLV